MICRKKSKNSTDQCCPVALHHLQLKPSNLLLISTALCNAPQVISHCAHSRLSCSYTTRFPTFRNAAHSKVFSYPIPQYFHICPKRLFITSQRIVSFLPMGITNSCILNTALSPISAYKVIEKEDYVLLFVYHVMSKCCALHIIVTSYIFINLKIAAQVLPQHVSWCYSKDRIQDSIIALTQCAVQYVLMPVNIHLLY